MDDRQRNKRALIILVLVAVLGSAYRFALVPWLSHWEDVRAAIAMQQEDLKILGLLPDPDRQLAERKIREVVPAFVMPEEEEVQKIQFEKELRKQLGSLGGSLPKYTGQRRNWSSLGVEQLSLQYSGKTNFGGAMDILVRLEENPYLVGIEEFKMSCDPKKRQEITVDVTVSTFVKKK